MTKIVVELDSVEAHLILGPIGDAQISERLRAARLTGEAGEAAAIRADVLGRVAGRIVEGLMPEDPRDVILREEYELGML